MKFVNRNTITLVCYIIAAYFVVLAHHDHSGMCGPSLAFIVYPIVFLTSFIFGVFYLVRVLASLKSKSLWIIFAIHFIGLSSLLIYVNFF